MDTGRSKDTTRPGYERNSLRSLLGCSSGMTATFRDRALQSLTCESLTQGLNTYGDEGW